MLSKASLKHSYVHFKVESAEEALTKALQQVKLLRLIGCIAIFLAVADAGMKLADRLKNTIGIQVCSSLASERTGY